jgi:peptidoglycan/xylan/chitin deacetylase (PgdA/CDA1 family)
VLLIACGGVAEPTFALIYHDVVDHAERDRAGFPGPVAGVYKLNRAQFRGHLDAIAATGVRCGEDGTRGPHAMLTFDDGGASAPWIGQQLERHGWRGAFFIVTSRIGTPGFMDASAIRELAERGHEIGSHSHTHPPFMARLPRAELDSEWRMSRERLTEVLGKPPPGAAVPGGSLSEDVVAAVSAAGYEYLLTSTPWARARRQAGIIVLGRNTIWARDSPELAAALVRGDPGARVRRWLSWQTKSAAKRVAPQAYGALRRARARAGGEAAARKATSRAV